MPSTGRFVLTDGANIVAGGAIAMRDYPDQRELVTVRSTNITAVAHRITADQRHSAQRPRGGVLWFTGLSGAGKSTIAMAVEQELFRRGYQVYVLDGDNVRHGLNANLGFSPEDRGREHPPRRRGRGAVRRCRPDRDHGVHLALSRRPAARARGGAKTASTRSSSRPTSATCEKRDPKGLYDGPQRRDRGIHRRHRAIRGAGQPPSSPSIPTACRSMRASPPCWPTWSGISAKHADFHANSMV